MKVRRHGKLGSALPVYEEAVTVRFVESSHEGDGISGVEALFFDETAPTFGHDVALAAGPVGVAEPPLLSGVVLEAER